MLTKKILKTIETLNKNLNLNLSLSNRELYHSNFIAYIITQNPDIPLTFLKGIMEIENVKVEEIQREHKHIDLTLYLNNGKKIILENKMKDYPTRKQLERYSKEVPDADYRILLTPFEINNTTLPDDWNIIHYSDIVGYLRLVQKNKKFDEFIEDYIELCDNLDILFKSINTDITKSTYGEADELITSVRHLRLDSAVERIFRNAMLDSIDSKFDSYSGRARGAMHFGAVVHLEEGYSIDIQIENGEYRCKLNTSKELVNKNAFFIADALKESGLVFNFSDELKPRRGGKWNQYGLGRLSKDYNIYTAPVHKDIKSNAKSLDIYTYKKIDSDMSNSRIIELMNQDLRGFEENREQILKIIKSFE